jgi:hypothetical protein
MIETDDREDMSPPHSGETLPAALICLCPHAPLFIILCPRTCVYGVHVGGCTGVASCRGMAKADTLPSAPCPIASLGVMWACAEGSQWGGAAAVAMAATDTIRPAKP